VSGCGRRPQSKPDVQLLAVSRLETILDALQKFYGVLPPLPRDPFTLFVWEVLSVHSTPRKRDAALAALKRIPAMTPDSMARAAETRAEPRSLARTREPDAGAADRRRAVPALAATPAIIRGLLLAARRARSRSRSSARRARTACCSSPPIRDSSGRRPPATARRRATSRRVAQRQEALVMSWRRRPTPTRAFLYLSHHGGATCLKATRTVQSVRCLKTVGGKAAGRRRLRA
jgi:hypothetical protein